MLDSETKRKIDNCRDILVGKVPNPISQVQQITLALVYKFMDDMDNRSIELGGKASFFVGDLKPYAWSKLLDSKFTHDQRRDLYVRGLAAFEKSSTLPDIFQKIFKNAFLPFADGTTLSLFLKTINEFEYDHSEVLGNAFEYLLSCLGSQGDAGQFRTPRNIIDFIIELVEPAKGETILDPACGTAGFLISAYKYIIKNNKNINAKEKRDLMGSIVGYDISPEMIQFSVANMYLHSFPKPKILEYDTLSSENFWNDKFDVILANPPFMTPKGGIIPHSKFSLKSNKAEVLFAEYIAEHLLPDGRAGFIVPEGIIFQTANAYKKLRKKLIEEQGLIAVISLPAGIFNPYSGVKTSVLLIDKRLSKNNDEILFINVQNDGFDLGAQRRAIDKNDLPEALEIFKKYKDSLASGKKYKASSDMALTVKKSKIAEHNYVFHSSKYVEKKAVISKFPLVELGDVCSYEQPTNYIVNSVDYDNSYTTPVLTAGKTFILGYTNETSGIYNKNLPVIIFDDFTTDIKFVDFPFKVKSSAMKILSAVKEKANISYLYYIMKGIDIDHSTHKRYWISEYSKVKIPLPPLDVQEQIVAEIKNKQDAIDNARAIIESLERERDAILAHHLK